jgi:hypothetical protein
MAPIFALLVPLESLGWLGLHQFGFKMFQATMEKLLNIEQLFLNFFYLKKKWNLGMFLLLLESP